MTSSAMGAPITLRLAFEPSAVSVARQQLKCWLDGMAGMSGPRESVEDARVVISELVANSVRHARPLSDGGLLVSWTLDDDGLQVSVTDGGGSTRPHPVQAAPTAAAGRGMAIVDVLSQAWWTEGTESRSTVHALLGV